MRICVMVMVTQIRMPDPMPTSEYPAHREADVVLRDGATVHVRPVSPDDDHRLLIFFRSLSARSRSLRFFSPTTDVFLMGEARREADVDYVKTFGLLATTGLEERVVGHALYVVPLDGDRAGPGEPGARGVPGRG